MESLDDLCIDCCQPSAYHHTFRPPVRPEGCICDPLSYGDPGNIPAICAEFTSSTDEFGCRYCNNCEHDYECHLGRK